MGPIDGVRDPDLADRGGPVFVALGSIFVGLGGLELLRLDPIVDVRTCVVALGPVDVGPKLLGLGPVVDVSDCNVSVTVTTGVELGAIVAVSILLALA